MPATSPTIAHLHAAPVQEGLQFSAADLEKMPLLGEGHRLQYREVWLDIYEDALAQHPVSQNEFLVLLATEANRPAADTPRAWNVWHTQATAVEEEELLLVSVDQLAEEQRLAEERAKEAAAQQVWPSAYQPPLPLDESSVLRAREARATWTGCSDAQQR